jgi:hypothetical protein
MSKLDLFTGLSKVVSFETDVSADALPQSAAAGTLETPKIGES